MSHLIDLIESAKVLVKEKHLPGQHNQDDHGNWADGGESGMLGPRGSKAEAQKIRHLLDLLEKEKGFSIDVVGWKPPVSGSMVSIYPDREKQIVDLGKSSFEEQQDLIGDYVADNSDLLELPDHYLGGWLEKGVVFLDVSVNIASQEKAMKLGIEHNQYAIFDVKSCTVIKTGYEGAREE